MATYIHGTDDDEQRRLSLMNDVLLNAAMLREMNLRGDERILDLGSGLGQFTRMMARAVPNGHVVGIENSDEQLNAAKRLAANDGETSLADLRSGEALNLDLGNEWGTFDVAHTRFLLEHISDPLRAVKSMVRAVKPGGRIVLADDDHGVMRLWPEPPGWMSLWDAYMRAYERIGNDPHVGRRLVQLLHEAGAQPLRNTWVFFGGCAGMETFPILAANMAGVVRTARDTIIANGLFEAAFDRVMDDYRVWSQRPDAALWFSVAWAEGVKNG
ncbi:MAG TPA: methyltransferase domain-containing protein [Thermoanaerobaculia bacterium]|jgi:ubiquinone/menaquinone biosynthesis C-methylase UbiE|nr:methyltransferase domain-containing protein [Thermoanaerobaculia bacterium]